jgi:hypothetical protein
MQEEHSLVEEDPMTETAMVEMWGLLTEEQYIFMFSDLTESKWSIY